MPDDVAAEKALALRALGAQIEKVRPASIVDKNQVRTDKSNGATPLRAYLVCGMQPRL